MSNQPTLTTDQKQLILSDPTCLIVLGSEVYLWRLREKVGAKDLSESSGVNKDQLSSFEDGKQSLSLQGLESVCEVMGVSFVDLCQQAQERSAKFKSHFSNLFPNLV